MKGKFLALLVFVFCGFLAFAQTGNTAFSISDTDLNKMVTDYLQDTFNTYLNKDNLKVTELSCTTDWNASNNDKNNLNHYIAQARFRNFPIDKRFLTGRLETKVVVRKNAGAFMGFGGKPGIEKRDQKDLNITLLVDDQLTDELRDSYVRDYITRNYENPLDIIINNEKLEVYPDKIFSYVSSVVNNDSIVYLRAVFEPTSKIKKISPFTIQETPWQLNRAEPIFSESFPDETIFRKDIEEEIFEPMRGYYINTVGGSANPKRGGSKIESVTRSELKEANASMIKLELELIYLLDWWGFRRSYKRYKVILNTFYKFNFEKQQWEYNGIDKDAIKGENISPIG